MSHDRTLYLAGTNRAAKKHVLQEFIRHIVGRKYADVAVVAPWRVEGLFGVKYYETLDQVPLIAFEYLVIDDPRVRDDKEGSCACRSVHSHYHHKGSRMRYARYFHAWSAEELKANFETLTSEPIIGDAIKTGVITYSNGKLKLQVGAISATVSDSGVLVYSDRTRQWEVLPKVVFDDRYVLVD